MSSARSRRPSASLVVSIVALLMSCSGVAVATGLGPNTVGTPQLKNNAVTSAKIMNGQVGSADLAPGVRAQVGKGIGREAYRDGAVPITAATETSFTRVATLRNLPAGGYLLTAKTNIVMTEATDEYMYGACRLRSSTTDYDLNQVSLAGAFTRTTMSFTLMVTFGSRTNSAIVECSRAHEFSGPSSSDSMQASQTKIAAVQLTSERHGPVTG